jgi:hypothetical protein
MLVTCHSITHPNKGGDYVNKKGLDLLCLHNGVGDRIGNWGQICGIFLETGEKFGISLLNTEISREKQRVWVFKKEEMRERGYNAYKEEPLHMVITACHSRGGGNPALNYSREERSNRPTRM